MISFFFNTWYIYYGEFMIRKMIKFLLVILCMVFIFSLSSENDVKSTKRSDSVIVHTAEFFLGRKLTKVEHEKYIDKFVYVVRKSAHFCLYGLLGFLMISFLCELYHYNKRLLWITILLVFCYALSDEIHQLFVSGRSGEAFDVLIDTIGGFCGIKIYRFFDWIRRRRYEQKKAVS